MKKFEKTIQAWYNSGERQFRIGEYLFDHDYREMPCYHYRMSAEIFLKSLNLVYIHYSNLEFFDNTPTHDITDLRKKIKNNIASSQSNILKSSVDVFILNYPEYKYVISKDLSSPRSPSALFNQSAVKLHREAAEAILKVTRDCLNQELPNII